MSTSDRLNTDALSPLFLAVDEGNNENVIQILESDPNININEATILTTEQLTDHWKELAGNWTPFQWACRHNLLPIVDTLIAKGADVQLCREVSGNSCLFYAACCPDSIKLVLLLLEKAPNLVSHKSKDNWTPLMVASQNGYVPVVEALIQHGAPVLDKNNLGRSSLFLASEAGKPAVVEILLKTDALNTVNEQSSSGSFPLYAACKHGHLNVVKLLVEKGADVHQKNNNGWTTLQQTCLKGDLTMLQYLISKGASVNDKANDGTCPVYIAVQNGFVSILEMLILHGADITEESNGTDGKTPLMAACPMGHFNTAQLLLKKGATVNAADYKQNTALILASQAGHLPLVKELLAYGANVHAKCNDGRTALMFASQKGHFEVVVVLFAAGALLNDCDSAGLTALHHVCLSTDITEEKASEIIRFLIACGADSSIQSVQGDLALGLARTDKIRNELNHAIRDKNEGTLNSKLYDFLNDERIGLQVQCNSLTAALEEATRKCFEYKEKAARRKNELEKTGKLTWWLQEQSYVYEQKIAELEKTISTLTGNLAELRSQQNEKDILISLLEQQNLQLTEESGRKEQLLQTQTQQIEKYARQIVQLQEELKTQESSCPASSMKKKIQELASTLVTIINENQVLEERNAALEAQTTAALASKKEAEKKLIDAETTVSSLVLLNSDLEQKVEEAKAMVTEKDTEVKSLEKENLCLEAENSKLKGTVEQLYEVITKQSLINSIGGGSGSGSESGSSGSNPSLICFSDDSLRTATSDYTDKNKLVSSVSGDFYKGTHYQTPIMVRKTREGASLNTLAQDLSILSRFRHVNILGLLGYSGDIKNCSLVFEYAPNGTLRERLDKKGNTPPLSWPERLSIAFDIAVALNYLQNADSRAPVFHLGLTSSNVFLDSQFRAKISGFESAKPACFQDNLSGSNAFINHSPSVPRPNIDPIFALERKVSRKTDVYSYGCVLLELLTGMHISLGICAKLANHYKHKGHIKDQLDKDLKANEAELDSSVDVVSKIFYQSVQISWLERPGFPQIIKTLMDKSDFSVQGEHNDCSVCTGEPINSQFGPCGHSVMCQECAQKWITEKRDCLVCSLPVTSFSVLPTTPNEDYVIM